ncbi:MAG: hypothetical protein IJR66_00155 [Clostridia bacterium]|nr:hypothetical protein [Clostridia bacterium]
MDMSGTLPDDANLRFDVNKFYPFNKNLPLDIFLSWQKLTTSYSLP